MSAVVDSRPSSLDAIGRRYKSDKSSLVHGYLDAYEHHIRHLVERPITLIEFGDVATSTLGMWAEYFPRATIVGAFPSGDAFHFTGDRIKIEIGRQDDAKFLLRLVRTYQPHLVIDDGTHNWADQINTLKHLLPALQPGGTYIVEDLHTNFGELASTYQGDAPISAFAYIASLLPGLAGGAALAEGSEDTFPAFAANVLESITFVRQACLLRRLERVRKALIPIAGLQDLGLGTKLDNGGSYRRCPITVVNSPDWLRALLDRRIAEEVVVPPEARVARLPNATVLHRGIVLTRGQRLVRESLINSRWGRIPGFHRIGQSNLVVPEQDIEARDVLDGPVHVLLKQTWDSNYGHWLVESLPRVALVAILQDTNACRFIVAMDTEAMQRVYVDSLALFGIPPEHIVFTSDAPIRVEQLLYPSPLTVQPWVKAPLAVQVLEKLARPLETWNPAIVRHERLYVSRNRAGRRRLLNEDELLQLVTARGYVPVCPEQLSLYDQIATFSRARRVIGNLGAALSNLAFAQRGVRLLALTSQFMQDDFFWDLISHKAGRYLSLHGIAAAPDDGMNSDFTISPDQLEAMLDDFEAE
jgi:capsular polysaccharide biosynthesis protein